MALGRGGAGSVVGFFEVGRHDRGAMKILVFGSINIDHVYQVEHFVRPGETLASTGYQRFCGGKGANQAIALARTGTPTFMAGKIGRDGEWPRDYLARAGVDVSGVKISDGPSGDAIIQLTPQGENAILLLGGANHAISEKDVDETLKNFSAGDLLLVQNEISSMPEILREAKGKGLKVFFNPAPMNAAVKQYPLDCVDYLIVNETEGAELTGKTSPKESLAALRKQYPQAAIVQTMGGDGVLYADANGELHVPALQVKAVDTTAAGDTFIGYFMASLASGMAVKASLERASRAAALKITRMGAAASIPTAAEVDA